MDEYDYYEALDMLQWEIDDLKKENKVLKKALGLLKDKNSYYNFVNENAGTINVELALLKAKEIMKSE